MTSPSQPDDLVARLRKEARAYEAVPNIRTDPETDAGTGRLLREAADFIETLTQPAVPDAGREVELFALTYLHDWDPPREDGSRPIYPKVSAVYPSWREANDAGKKKVDPNKYWVVSAHTPEPLVTKSSYDALAAAKDELISALKARLGEK